MSENKVRIKLGPAPVVKTYLPVLALGLAGFMVFLGKNNKFLRVGAGIALAIGLKGFLDLRSGKNKANIIYNEAIGEMGVKKPRETLDKLEAGLELDRTNPYLNYGLLMINYQNRNFKNVLKFIDNVDLKRIKKGSNILLDKDLLMTMKSVSLFEEGEYEKALNFLEEIKDSENLYKLLTGLSYRELGQLERSVEVLGSGLVRENGADELAFNYWLGVNYFDMGRTEEAGQLFKKVQGEDKNYIDLKGYLKKLEGK